MFTIDIITPEKIHSSTTVQMAVLPAQDGQLGLLTDHAPIISALEKGEIYLYEKDDKTISQSLKITGGFAEMIDNKCVVLAEAVVTSNKAV